MKPSDLISGQDCALLIEGFLPVGLELADPAIDRLAVYVEHLEDFLWLIHFAQHQVHGVELELLCVPPTLSFGHLGSLLFVISYVALSLNPNGGL